MSTQHSGAEIQFRLHDVARRPGEAEPASPPEHGHVPRVTQVMALAIQFQEMIRLGDARDYADLARLGCITRERMSQIMELVWLAPDIQQEIVEFPPSRGGRFPISEAAVRGIAALLSWNEQRSGWRELKNNCHI